MQLDDGSFHKKVDGVPDHLAGKGEGFEALLVHEVETTSVAVQVGCLDHAQVRLLEPVTGLAGLVKDGAVEKVAHLQADQGLAAPGGRGGNLRFQAHEWRVFQLKKHFALYVDGIDQCGHDLLRRQGPNWKISLGSDFASRSVTGETSIG